MYAHQGIEKNKVEAAAKKKEYEEAKKERRKISDAKFRAWKNGRATVKRKRSYEQHIKNKRSK